jgi:xanthine dehydrogenase accessory factor
MKLWNFIKTKLSESKRIMLLVVIDSQGSSPGRQGFKMAVCEDSTLEGSVGGGVMEYNIVELGKAMLQLGRTGPI